MPRRIHLDVATLGDGRTAQAPERTTAGHRRCDLTGLLLKLSPRGLNPTAKAIAQSRMLASRVTIDATGSRAANEGDVSIASVNCRISNTSSRHRITAGWEWISALASWRSSRMDSLSKHRSLLRKLSRAERHGRNRKKLRARIANICKDALHHLTAFLSANDSDGDRRPQRQGHIGFVPLPISGSLNSVDSLNMKWPCVAAPSSCRIVFPRVRNCAASAASNTRNSSCLSDRK